MNDVNIAINDFINASMNNGSAQEDGNANLANKYYRVIEKRIKWLNDNSEITNPDFLVLLAKVIFDGISKLNIEKKTNSEKL